MHGLIMVSGCVVSKHIRHSFLAKYPGSSGYTNRSFSSKGLAFILFLQFVARGGARMEANGEAGQGK